MTLGTVVDTEFEARWLAWQRKGAAQDRAYRQKLWRVLPGLLLVAVVAMVCASLLRN